MKIVGMKVGEAVRHGVTEAPAIDKDVIPEVPAYPDHHESPTAEGQFTIRNGLNTPKEDQVVRSNVPACA
jgi:hypothetical protein